MNSGIRLECHGIVDGFHVTRWNVDAVDVREQTIAVLRAFEENVTTGEVPDSGDSLKHWHCRRFLDVSDGAPFFEAMLHVCHIWAEA